MRKKSGFLFIAGGLIGAAVTLLYAPRSGEETRQLLVENSQEIKDKALKSIQEVQDLALDSIEDTRARLEILNQETRERLLKPEDNGRSTLEEQQKEENLSAEASPAHNPN